MVRIWRISDVLRDVLRWLQDAAAVAVLTAAIFGLVIVILRAIQVAVP